jgi:hypothetical protein
MNSSQLNKSRFIVGILLILISVLMFLFVKGNYSTTGAIGIGVLGFLKIYILSKVFYYIFRYSDISYNILLFC